MVGWPFGLYTCAMYALLNTVFEILAIDQIGYIVISIVIVAFALATCAAVLLKILIAFGQFPQTSQRVWTELVQDSWDKLGQFFIFAIAVDGKRV